MCDGASGSYVARDGRNSAFGSQQLKTVMAMSRTKIALIFGLFTVSLLLFMIPVLAQDTGTDGGTSVLEHFRLCQAARQALREAGTPINPDDLPETCRLNSETRPLAACRAAIQALRDTTDEPVTQADIQELEACASLPRFNSPVDASTPLSDAGESPLRQNRERRYGWLDSYNSEPGQRSTPCLEALQALRSAGERVTRDNLPEVCQTSLAP
jgi:hypothetical protein